MQISSFNGGLNKRVSPYLMQSNEGVKYSNIDTTTGALAPLKENKNLNANIKPNFTYFNNHWVDSDESRDYVKFQEKLFYSNGQTRPQWSKDGFTWYGLGIDKPAKAPQISAKPSESVPDVEVVIGQIDNSKYFFDLFTQGFFDSATFKIYVDDFKENIADETIICKAYKLLKAYSYRYARNVSFLSPSFNKADSYCFVEDGGKYKKITPSYVGTSSNWTYIKSNTTANVMTSTDSEEFDFFNIEGQTITLIAFEMSEAGSVYYSVNVEIPELPYSSGDDTNTPINFVKYIKLSSLSPDSTELKVFFNGYNLTTKKLSSSEFIVIFERTSLTLEAYLNSESIDFTSYVYTYVSVDGVESAPSDSQGIPTKFYPTIVSVSASDDPQVNTIRLYRQKPSAGAAYQLVSEYPNKDMQVVDDKSDLDIIGSVLNSYNNLPAPEGLQYLTLYNTMLFGSIDDKLYYTDVATPFVWSGFNFIDFDDTITGLGGTPNGLLVFTKHSTYIVTGTSPDTFSKYLLSSGVGCVLHKSIQSLHNSLIWLSDDSICVSSGGEIQSISRDKLDTLNFKTPRCSAVLNDVYYLSHNQGTLIADFRFGLVFRESDKVYYGLAVKDNTLYGVESDDSFVELNKGEATLALHYLSPKFSDGSISTLKTYKDIYFHSTGDLSVKVFLDDTLVGSKSLAEGFDEIKVSSEKTQGYSIQFEVEGKGTLNEIEYKIESRQNGR